MSESLFGSHDLVFTRDSKTSEYVGGGYLLNSELLNCGAPAFMSGGGGAGGKKRRSKLTKITDSNAQHLNSGSGSGSGSGSDSEYDSKSDYEYESGKVVNNSTKVSDLLHGNNNIGSGDSKKSKRVLAIPAGIFLIKSATTAKQPSSSSSSASTTSFSSTYDDSRIRAMFDDSNSVEDDDNSDDSSADAGASAGPGMAKSAVISEDLYSKLFKMLAPNDADRKRYWVSAATTCRVRNGIGKCTQESHRGVVSAAVSANKRTRKNRRAKIL